MPEAIESGNQDPQATPAQPTSDADRPLPEWETLYVLRLITEGLRRIGRRKQWALGFGQDDVAALEEHGTAPEQPAAKGKRSSRKGITVAEANQRMLDAIGTERDGATEGDAERVKWSAREWARYVGYSTSTIHKIVIWREYVGARERAKQERMARRRGNRKLKPRRYDD